MVGMVITVNNTTRNF